MLKINPKLDLTILLNEEIKFFLTQFSFAKENRDKFYNIEKINETINLNLSIKLGAKFVSYTMTNDDYVFIFFDKNYEELFRYLDPID